MLAAHFISTGASTQNLIPYVSSLLGMHVTKGSETLLSTAVHLWYGKVAVVFCLAHR